MPNGHAILMHQLLAFGTREDVVFVLHEVTETNEAVILLGGRFGQIHLPFNPHFLRIFDCRLEHLEVLCLKRVHFSDVLLKNSSHNVADVLAAELILPASEGEVHAVAGEVALGIEGYLQGLAVLDVDELEPGLLNPFGVLDSVYRHQGISLCISNHVFHSGVLGQLRLILYLPFNHIILFNRSIIAGLL